MTVASKSFLKGHAPKASMEPIKVTGDTMKQLIGVNDEQIKYLKAWSLPEYRNYSPGEQMMDLFVETATPKAGETVTDWGCGTGRAGHRLHKEGLDVNLVDFAVNCLDEQVKDELGEKFIEHDISQPIDLRTDYGICCDVMEHIPEEQVDAVLRVILENSLHCFFQISTVDDVFGHHEHIDADLHVTVKPYNWWLKKFADLGCIIHHSNDLPTSCIFYLTAHQTFKFNLGKVNTDPETVKENMRANAKIDIPQLTPHEEQDKEIMLLMGGPSLNDFEDEIIAQRKDGMPLVTMNGTYNWAIERGLKPSLQCLIDARPFNKRFVEPHELTEETKYIIASQCHPEVVKSVPKDRSFFWQVTLDDDVLPTVRELWGEMYKDWFPCPGGSTVGLRTICALQMLGFRYIHIYGFDCCVREEEHHAYRQEENDKCEIIDMRVGKGTEFDKTFRVQDWMATQAKEFQKLTPVYFQNLHLDIKGDGLIAHLVKSGAKLTENT